MQRCGSDFEGRRIANARALAAFGVTAPRAPGAAPQRCVRPGGEIALFTIGYERRTIDQLLSRLREVGVEVLADVRQNPTSRRPEFRGNLLGEQCARAGITYDLWCELGSTEDQRDDLKESGDMTAFQRRFRSYATRYLGEPLDRLARLAEQKRVALLCYELRHEECHRSIVADLVACRLNATVFAL